MKRLYLVFLLLACLTTVGYPQEKKDITQTTVRNPNLLRQLLVNRFDLVEADIADLQAFANLGRAQVFYVYSVTGSDTYTGEDKDHPLATLDAAIGKCTANRGDIIILLQNHAETMGAVDLDVAGVTVIGLGTGTDRPTFTFDTNTDKFIMGRTGDNCTVYNVCFFPSVSECTKAIDWEDGCDNSALINCEFLESTTAANEFDIGVLLAVEANDVTIQGCRFTSADAVGATAAISATGGVLTRPTITDNIFFGEYSNAPVYSDQINTNMVVTRNVVTNLTASQFGIEFTANATGVIFNNRVNTTEDYEVDPGSCAFWNNDEGKAMPEGTSIYDLVGTLINVAAGTDVYPSGVTNDSILAMILSKSGTAAASSYDNTTDSLEALSDKITTVDDFLDTEIAAILADTAAMDTEAEWADLGSTLVDNIVAAMDANSTDLAILNDLAGISQVGDKVQADMDANSVLYWQPRCISVAADEVTQDLFAVAGGAIEILSFYGLVDVDIGANATTCKIWADATAGAAWDIDFSTAVNIETDTAGARYVFTSANPSVLTPLATAGGGTNFTKTWYCPVGMIEQEMSADPGGAAGDHITWFMVWRPLAAGVTVTAQ